MNILFSTLGIRAPSPIVPIRDSLFSKKEVEVYVKREDLLHPVFGGNKIRKLKYNLATFQQEGYDGIVTFGGAFSNHIYASAAIGSALGIPIVGVIRGEWEEIKDNPTIRFAQEQGMVLASVSRSAYRDKSSCVDKLNLEGKYYVLPEGGSNKLALRGCAEVIEEVDAQFDQAPDFILVSAGTGGTAAGCLSGMESIAKFGAARLLVFPALKGQWMKSEILSFLGQHKNDQLIVNTSFHCGGYGKWNDQLIDFIQSFYRNHDIPLDPIYNGKLFQGCVSLIEADYFPRGSTILLIHTGGLQGIAGYEQRTGKTLL